MKPSPDERTGWRDEALSLRHKEWGFNCPACDLDFVLLEYEQSKVAALIEYKNELAQHVDPETNTDYKALIDLGDRAGVMVFEVRYTSDLRTYSLKALNKLADEFCDREQAGFALNELEYVRLLYRMRKRHIGFELESILKRK